MKKSTKILIIPALLFAFGLAMTTQLYMPTALAQSDVINVCSHRGTHSYNILGGNTVSLRAKLDNTANFGPNGAYGDYDFKYIDVGDDFTKQTLVDNKCSIWFSGYEADSSYTPNELSELQSWVQDTKGQVIAGCDDTTTDPVCALLNFSVTTDTDSYGFLTNTAADNPLNCNGALAANSQLEMAGGIGGYFSGPGVTAQNVLAVHETGDVADASKPIVVYTGNFFLTADIDMITTGTLSDGPNVENNNDTLAMNAFSALADASVGKEICSSVVEVTPTPTASGPSTDTTPSPTPTPTKEGTGTGDVHFFTPDGLKYDFQGTGEFVAVQSSDGMVIVQARQENPPNHNRVSVNTAVAFMVGEDKVEFYVKPETTFYLYGEDEPRELPASLIELDNGGSINPIGSESRPEFIITWPDGTFTARVILFADNHLDYGVAGLADSRTYAGLMGNFDGNALNDLQTSDGNQLTAPPSVDDLNAFGDSWRVPAGESLFRSVESVTEQPHTLVTFDEETAAQAEATCREGGISNELALKNCVYDVALTDDPVFVESAKTVEESVEKLPPAAIVPATAGEALGGAIFDADQGSAQNIAILDGDDLVITTGTSADGASHLRLSIYRNGAYIVSFSVSTEAADTLTKAMMATNAPETTVVTGTPDLAQCREGVAILLENLPLRAETTDWPDFYAEIDQEFLVGCAGLEDDFTLATESVDIADLGFAESDLELLSVFSDAPETDSFTVGLAYISDQVSIHCPESAEGIECADILTGYEVYLGLVDATLAFMSD